MLDEDKEPLGTLLSAAQGKSLELLEYLIENRNKLWSLDKPMDYAIL